MRKLMAVALIGGMLFAHTGPVSASKPKTVWEDPAGDAGPDPALAGVFEGSGFDLVKGEIARNKKNLEFTVTHAGMPPSGSLPEGFRFLWGFAVDGEQYRFTVKSADIGKPDAAAGQTSERVGRVDLEGHFRLEGECVEEAGVGVNMVNCPPLAYLDGVWDPGTASFTVTVPMKEIKAKTKSRITAGSSGICQICWVTHTAERSLNAVIFDSAGMASTYRVPKK